MEIYLIRHTSLNIDKGVCYGQSDIDVASLFEEEAQVVLDQLPTNIEIVYSSPLKRCLGLANKIGDNPIIDNRLLELNFGDWEMKKWDKIPALEIQSWYDDYVNTPCLNGESYLELNKRAIEFYHYLINQNYKSVAVVTHGGVLRSILAHIDQIELIDSFEKINTSYGEVIEIK